MPRVNVSKPAKGQRALVASTSRICHTAPVEISVLIAHWLFPRGSVTPVGILCFCFFSLRDEKNERYLNLNLRYIIFVEQI